MKLGDVAQSMVLHDGKGYVVVNNSGVIYVIDPATFRTGLIEEVVSPRYIHFVDGQTAYVTDPLRPAHLRRRHPHQPNPLAHRHERAPLHRADGAGRGAVFVNCWSYDNKILVVDTRTERLADSLTVGWQPNSLLLDGNGKLWTATDGRDGEAPALWRIDPCNTRNRTALPNSRPTDPVKTHVRCA